jgi:hypothetical protein
MFQKLFNDIKIILIYIFSNIQELFLGGNLIHFSLWEVAPGGNLIPFSSRN